MTPDRQTAQALAETFSAETIRTMRTTALKVKMESGTITRSYEGSSMTIDANNCQRVIGECNEALAILAAIDAEEVRELTTEPVSRGIDFRFRTCS